MYIVPILEFSLFPVVLLLILLITNSVTENILLNMINICSIDTYQIDDVNQISFCNFFDFHGHVHYLHLYYIHHEPFILHSYITTTLKH